MPSSITLCIAAALASTLPDVCEDSAKGFALQARTLIALEGGPATLEVTLSYQGKDNVTIRNWTGLRMGNLRLVAPEGWKMRLYEVLGGNAGTRVFKKGDKVTTRIYLHHEYVSIPKGKAHFELTWSKVLTSEEGKEDTPSCTSVVDVDVLPATKERLTDLCADIQKKLNRSDLREWDERDLVDTMTYTEHLEFAPAGFRLLASNQERAENYLGPLRLHLFGCAQRSQEAREMLIEYLEKRGKRRDASFFSDWKEKHVELTEKEVAKLMWANDLWIRAHTYDLFPEKCRPDAKERLREDLKALRKLTVDLDK